MNISSSSSGYVSGPSSNKGFSGLASGMDTESMVEAMLAGTQAKIDKQKGIKQQTIWKQDMYRNIITKINGFQNKYFGASSPTNFMSKNFWNTMKVSTESKAFSVTAGPNATVGKTSVSVSQLARAAKVSSQKPLDATLKGEVNFDEIQKQIADQDKKVTFLVDSKEVEVDLKAAKDPQAVVDTLNKAFTGNGLDGIQASIGSDGQVQIVSKNNADIRVSDKSSDAGLQALGLSRTSVSESYEVTPPTPPAPNPPPAPAPGPDGSTPPTPTPDPSKPDPDAKPPEKPRESKLVGSKPIDTNDYFTVDVSVDGVKNTIQVNMTGVTDVNQFAAEMNKSLEKAFGTAVNVTMSGKEMTFNVDPGRTVMVSGSNAGLLGVIDGQSNRLGLGGSLDLYFGQNGVVAKGALDANGEASFNINGVEIKVNKDMTVGDLIRKVNSSGAGVTMAYHSTSNTFSLTQNNTGEGFKVDVKDTSGSMLSTLFGKDASGKIGTFEAGQNAKAKINGQDVERSSNSFEFDGLNFTLNSVTTKDETVEVNRDTDSVIEGVKSFVKDYNAMLEEFNNLLEEDSEYREYPPLTDAQKKEMTEKEITLWEEKAKKGLLRNDATLSNFLQSMRSAMYEKVPGTDLALYDLGIVTGEWDTKGQLVFDEEGEATLRRMLESDSEQVAKFFTDEENGFGARMNKAMQNAASTTYIPGGVNGRSSFGAFVELAGEKGKYSETQSSMHKQLESIDQKIKDLKGKYEQEKSRYWKKFNAMEKMIAQLSSQSAWLGQQFA